MKELEYHDFSASVFDQSLDRGQVVRAQMELTYRCNLHCRHCYTDPYNQPKFFPKEMAFEEIIRILDEMAELKILWLNLTGGEIFMRKDFFGIYEHALQKGFLVTLYTNGTILTSNVVERLRQNPPFAIDVSCHSLEESSFDGFTQVRGSFQDFMEGIGRLKASGLRFTLKSTLMNWNRDQIPQLKKFAEDLEARYGLNTLIQPRLTGNTDVLEMRLSPQDLDQFEFEGSIWDEDADACQKARGLIAQPEDDRLYRCGCATNTIHINAWGELGTCVFEYESRASLRTHSVREAIQKVFSEIREMRYKGETPCRACQLHSFCEKTPTSSRYEGGDRNLPVEYHCDVAYSRAQALTQTAIEHPLKRKGKNHEIRKETVHAAPNLPG